MYRLLVWIWSISFQVELMTQRSTARSMAWPWRRGAVRTAFVTTPRSTWRRAVRSRGLVAGAPGAVERKSQNWKQLVYDLYDIIFIILLSETQFEVRVQKLYNHAYFCTPSRFLLQLSWEVTKTLPTSASWQELAFDGYWDSGRLQASQWIAQCAAWRTAVRLSSSSDLFRRYICEVLIGAKIVLYQLSLRKG